MGDIDDESLFVVVMYISELGEVKVGIADPDVRRCVGWYKNNFVGLVYNSCYTEEDAKKATKLFLAWANTHNIPDQMMFENAKFYGERILELWFNYNSELGLSDKDTVV